MAENMEGRLSMSESAYPRRQDGMNTNMNNNMGNANRLDVG